MPLHVAVVNGYHNLLKGSGSKALTIIGHLLDFGADTKAKAVSIHICNVQNMFWLGSKDGTALEFALELKKLQDPGETHKPGLDAMIDKLMLKL